MAAGSFKTLTGTVIELPTATSRADYCEGWRLVPIGVEAHEYRPASTGGTDEDTVLATVGLLQGWNLEVDWIDDNEQTLRQALVAIQGTEVAVTLRQRNAAKSATNPENVVTVIIEPPTTNFVKGEIPRWTNTYRCLAKPAETTI